MKALILLTTLTMAGCVGFTDKAGATLATVQAAAVSARETMLPIADGLCNSVAETCRDLQDQECKALSTCQDIRRKIIQAVIGIHYAILDANTALAIGDEESTWLAIDKALDLVRLLRVQMRSMGIGA